MEKYNYNPITHDLDMTGDGAGDVINNYGVAWNDETPMEGYWIQKTILPSPSASQLGRVYQYVGETTAEYTHNYFYECVEIGGVYYWQRVNVQPSGGGGGAAVWGEIGGDIDDQTDLAETLNGKIGRLDVTFVVDTTDQLATKTAVMGDTAIVKTTGKMHTYGSTWDGGVNGEYGVIYIGENEQYIWDTTKFILLSTENAKTLNGKGEWYFAKNSEAAKRDGSYPLMNVGSANNLTGGFKVSKEFSEDTAGGSADIADGVAEIERVKGNSIVWRNLIPRMRVVGNTIENWLFSGGTLTPFVTETSNEISYTNASFLQPAVSYRGTTIIGRKYYWIVRAKSSKADNYVFCSPLKGGTINPYGVADEFVTISVFGVAIRDWTDGGIRFSQAVTDTTTIDKRIGMVLIDVSSIEESTGKEFQTKSDFESWLAHSGFENYFGYNAGEIFNINPIGIKTQGFNAYNPTTGKAYVIGGNQYQITGAYTSVSEGDVAITPDSGGKFTPTNNGELTIAGGDSTTTCVHLVWSGGRDGEYEEHWEETRNIDLQSILHQGSPLFADGLCSVGEVYDELTAKRAVKRIGRQTITGAVGDTVTLTGCKATATEYLAVHDYGTLANGVLTLTAAVTAQDVYFELATPIVVEFSEPLNLNYRVSDFGTEMLLPINGSEPTTAPMKVDVVYGLNVVDFVRNANRNFVTIEDSTGDNGSTFTNLRSALSNAFGIDIAPTYNATNKRYTFTITDNRKVEVPASATASGRKATWAEDDMYVYFCTDTDTWVKIAKQTW